MGSAVGSGYRCLRAVGERLSRVLSEEVCLLVPWVSGKQGVGTLLWNLVAIASWLAEVGATLLWLAGGPAALLWVLECGCLVQCLTDCGGHSVVGGRLWLPRHCR